jgi:hypothetical protein
LEKQCLSVETIWVQPEIREKKPDEFSSGFFIPTPDSLNLPTYAFLGRIFKQLLIVFFM